MHDFHRRGGNCSPLSSVPEFGLIQFRLFSSLKLVTTTFVELVAHSYCSGATGVLNTHPAHWGQIPVPSGLVM